MCEFLHITSPHLFHRSGGGVGGVGFPLPAGIRRRHMNSFLYLKTSLYFHSL